MPKKKANKKSQVSLLQKRSNKAQKRIVNKKKVYAFNQASNLPAAAQNLPLPSSVPVMHNAPGNTVNPTTPTVIENIEHARNYVQRFERNSEPYRVIPSRPLAITYDPPKKEYPIVPYVPPKKIKKEHPIVPYTPIVKYTPKSTNTSFKKTDYMNLATNVMDYINSGALNNARSNPGSFFDGLSTAVMSAGSFVPGAVGTALKGVGFLAEGGKFIYNWHQDKKKDKKEKKQKRQKWLNKINSYTDNLNAQQFFRIGNMKRSMRDYWSDYKAYKYKSFRDEVQKDRLFREEEYRREIAR